MENCNDSDKDGFKHLIRNDDDDEEGLKASDELAQNIVHENDQEKKTKANCSLVKNIFEMSSKKRPPSAKQNESKACGETFRIEMAGSPRFATVRFAGVGKKKRDETKNDDDIYEQYWKKVQHWTLSECEACDVARMYKCRTIFKGQQQQQQQQPQQQQQEEESNLKKLWAAILDDHMSKSDDHDVILGMFETKEEAMRRATCGALVMAEMENQTKKTLTPAMVACTAMNPFEKFNESCPEANRSSSTAAASNPLDSSVAHKLSKPTTPTAAQSSISSLSKSEIISWTRSSRKRPPPTCRTLAAKISRHRRDHYWSGRPRACEMSNPQTKKVLGIYRSCSQAERTTKISRTSIGKVCRDGGGIVSGKYFRFVELKDEDDEDENINEDNKKTKPSQQQTNILMDNKGESSMCIEKHHEQQQQQQQLRFDDDNECSPPTNIETNDKNDKMATDKSFDASTILPLTAHHHCPPSPSSKPKSHLIELWDATEKKVLVCFRTVDDCAQALNVHRNQVKRACCQDWQLKDHQLKEKKNTDNCENKAIPFDGSFSLRYATSNESICAYLYGSHKEDYFRIQEGHEERLKRWKRMFQRDQQTRRKYCNSDHSAKVSASAISIPTTETEDADYDDRKISSEKNGNKDQEMLSSIEKTFPSRGHYTTSSKSKSAVLNSGDHEDAMNQSVSSLHNRNVWGNSNNHPNQQLLCIFCQQNIAQVILEPCHHFVLCLKCDTSGVICPKFCPICRIPIQSKSQQRQILRPRIFSAYSFM